MGRGLRLAGCERGFRKNRALAQVSITVVAIEMVANGISSSS